MTQRKNDSGVSDEFEALFKKLRPNTHLWHESGINGPLPRPRDLDGPYESMPRESDNDLKETVPMETFKRIMGVKDARLEAANERLKKLEGQLEKANNMALKDTPYPLPTHVQSDSVTNDPQKDYITNSESIGKVRTTSDVVQELTDLVRKQGEELEEIKKLIGELSENSG